MSQLSAPSKPNSALKNSASPIKSSSSMAMLLATSRTTRPVWQACSRCYMDRWGSHRHCRALAQSLCTGGIILIGEPYWRQLPPTEDVAKGCLAGSTFQLLPRLPELLASFGHLDYDVVEMVLADQDDWDRYEAAKWLTMRRWLEANPDDEFAKDVRAKLTLGTRALRRLHA